MKMACLGGGRFCPGLNAVIRAVVRQRALSTIRTRVCGIHRRMAGLVED